MRTRIFDVVSELATRRPWLVLVVAATLAVAGGALAWNSLRLDANLDDLIAPNRPFMVRYREFLREFGDLEFIYIVIDTHGDPQRAERSARRLVELLGDTVQGDSPDLREIHGEVPPEEQLRIATRAMADEDLAELALAAEGARLLADGATGAPSSPAAAMPASARSRVDPVDAATRAGELLRRAVSPTSPPAGEEGAHAAPTGDARLDNPRAAAAAAGVLLLKALLAGHDQATAAELGPLLPGQQKAEYLRSDTGRYLFVQILPRKDFDTLEVINEPLRRIRAAMDQVRAEEPGVDMGLTGKPVLQADELVTSNNDMVRGATLGLVLCALLLMVSMHSVLRPMLAVVAFIFAFGWTYGFATIAVGRINLLSNVFMLVLVAAGLDYGVHVLARYLEDRRREPAARLDRVIATATVTSLRGNVTGALTSCIVFLTAMATDFQGLKELGVIATGGLLLCVAAMGFVLPALMTLVERPGPMRVAPIARSGRFGFPSVRPVATLAVLGAATAILSWGLPRLHFEENLLQLQNPMLGSVKWEKRLADESSGNSWFGAAIVDRIEDVPAVLARAAARPSIGIARSVLDVVKPPTPGREAMRERIDGGRATTAASARDAQSVLDPRAPADAQPSVDPATPSTTPGSRALADALGRELGATLSALRLVAGAAALQSPEDAKRLGSIVSAAQRTVAALRGPDGPAVAARIATTFAAASASMRAILDGNALPLRDALPGAARNTAMSPDGRFLVMMHPRADVWDVANMRAFIDDMRSVDPDATGAPFTHYESLRDMRSAFLRMATLSVILVALLVLLDFKRPMDVLLAMLPLMLAMLWTFELMGIFHVSFNLANFFAVPILIGLGVDSSIHLLHRYHEGGADRLDPGSTRRAVILTNLTTTIGFAPLVFADHLGMRSLGLVMILGNTACLVAVLIVLPATLALRERLRRHRSIPDHHMA